MKKNAILLFIFISASCFSQSYIEGYIYDKEANTPVPYATIKIISAKNYYTISNEDGKIEINTKYKPDSLEVRSLGFDTKKVHISYLKNTKIIYLTPKINKLKTVSIVAKKQKNYVYNILHNLIRKYKKKDLIIKSKMFLRHTSYTKDVPLEIIESFYNSQQSLSMGIINLSLKSGRFGQNSTFPFYSLHNTDIVKSFNLFKKTNKMLPLFPGNLGYGALKLKYNLEFEQCANCGYHDVAISFEPNNQNGRFLSGKIIFNKETLIIKKIKLNIINPKIKGLSSVVKNHFVTPKKINISYIFDPNDYEKIQSVDFEFVMNYFNSNGELKIITSNSYLYFYDYGKLFEEPYFTSKIYFDNDYDKIVSLYASDDFWDSNYQFPRSIKDKKFIDYFKKYGYLINYDAEIPYNDMDDISASVITWRNGKILNWKDIKDEYSSNKKDEPLYYNSDGSLKTSVTFSSEFELRKYLSKKKKIEEYNFSYSLDSYVKNGKLQFTTQTLFDANSSFCKFRVPKKLIYINIIFDMYEVYNKELKMLLNDEITFEEAKILCDEKFKEATELINIMKRETNFGLNFQKLKRWQTRIKRRLNRTTYY